MGAFYLTPFFTKGIGYEVAVYYTFFCLILLIFMYYKRKTVLSEEFCILFKGDGRKTKSIKIGAAFLKKLTIILIFIIFFNLFKLSFVGICQEVATDNITFISRDELNSDYVSLDLIYNSTNSYIYTLKSEDPIGRFDFFRLKNKEINSPSIVELLQTAKFCETNYKWHYREIYNCPNLPVNQTLEFITINSVKKITQNISEIRYECNNGCCPFMYNPVMREFNGNEPVISFAYKKKTGLRDIGHYIGLFFPLDYDFTGKKLL